MARTLTLADARPVSTMVIPAGVATCCAKRRAGDIRRAAGSLFDRALMAHNNRGYPDAVALAEDCRGDGDLPVHHRWRQRGWPDADGTAFSVPQAGELESAPCLGNGGSLSEQFTALTTPEPGARSSARRFQLSEAT